MYWTKLLPLIQLAVVCFAQKHFNLKCTNCPKSCNNDCYAVYKARKEFVLYYPGPKTATQTRQTRRDSGCTQTSNGNSACGANGIAKYKPGGGTCDEYPYASVSQGGTEAVLRYVPGADNRFEGDQLSSLTSKSVANGGCASQPCDFKIFLETDTLGNS